MTRRIINSGSCEMLLRQALRLKVEDWKEVEFSEALKVERSDRLVKFGSGPVRAVPNRVPPGLSFDSRENLEGSDRSKGLFVPERPFS